VTDRRPRLAGIDERLHAVYGFGQHPELVGIDHAAGKKKRVEIVGTSFAKGNIDRQLVVPFSELLTAHAVPLGDTTRVFSSRLIESLARLGKLHLFKTIGDEDGNLHSLNTFMSHNLPPNIIQPPIKVSANFAMDFS
jgi:hypothetical protein